MFVGDDHIRPLAEEDGHADRQGGVCLGILQLYSKGPAELKGWESECCEVRF